MPPAENERYFCTTPFIRVHLDVGDFMEHFVWGNSASSRGFIPSLQLY
jgi:hypothetical protein